MAYLDYLNKIIKKTGRKAGLITNKIMKGTNKIITGSREEREKVKREEIEFKERERQRQRERE